MYKEIQKQSCNDTLVFITLRTIPTTCDFLRSEESGVFKFLSIVSSPWGNAYNDAYSRQCNIGIIWNFGNNPTGTCSWFVNIDSMSTIDVEISTSIFNAFSMSNKNHWNFDVDSTSNRRKSAVESFLRIYNSFSASNRHQKCPLESFSKI